MKNEDTLETTDVLMRFIKIAHDRPNHTAVELNGSATSYGQFLKLVQQLAQKMLHATPTGEVPKVLIRLARSPEAYAAMFAAFYAGGYYSPVNMDHPVELQIKHARCFKPNLIVSDSSDPATQALSNGLPIIDPKKPLEEDFQTSPNPSNEIAYVMFTSGTSGTPKGVMIGREALSHYVAWAVTAMNVTSSDRWSQHPNLGFDLSVLDIYGALCGGATLVPITDQRERLMPARAIQKHKLTIWNSVPSVVDLMKRDVKLNHVTLASLRLVTFCGEPLLKEHLDTLFSAKPDLLIHNTYGPTEATVSMTLLALTSGNYLENCKATVALGDPIPGMQIELVDGKDEQEGELYILGPQVALGYWESPELSAKSFDTVSIDGNSVRRYRTGDWVEANSGNLYFKSRIDRQVKINGHRLELSSIDAALRDVGALAACTIVFQKAIFSFVELSEAITPESIELALKCRLPPYALPKEIRKISELPRSANDKIDVRMLLSILESEFPAKKDTNNG
jgi:D-alanine--poly(phosphoribitol) ligase subunit 1